MTPVQFWFICFPVSPPSQDTIQLFPLGLTMLGMMLRNPGAISRVLLQVDDMSNMSDMSGEGIH